MQPGSSKDLSKSRVRNDTARDTHEAVVADAGETEVADRDLVHGDGGTIGLGPDEELRKDD